MKKAEYNHFFTTKGGRISNHLLSTYEALSEASITDFQSELDHWLHRGVYEKSEENEVLFETSNSKWLRKLSIKVRAWVLNWKF